MIRCGRSISYRPVSDATQRAMGVRFETSHESAGLLATPPCFVVRHVRPIASTDMESSSCSSFMQKPALPPVPGIHPIPGFPLPQPLDRVPWHLDSSTSLSGIERPFSNIRLCPSLPQLLTSRPHNSFGDAMTTNYAGPTFPCCLRFTGDIERLRIHWRHTHSTICWDPQGHYLHQPEILRDGDLTGNLLCNFCHASFPPMRMANHLARHHIATHGGTAFQYRNEVSLSGRSLDALLCCPYCTLICSSKQMIEHRSLHPAFLHLGLALPAAVGLCPQAQRMQGCCPICATSHRATQDCAEARGTCFRCKTRYQTAYLRDHRCLIAADGQGVGNARGTESHEKGSKPLAARRSAVQEGLSAMSLAYVGRGL